MDSLDDFAAGKLAALDRGGLRRGLVETERSALHVERNGRRLLSFSCNDYLNFTQHPAIKAAAMAAIERFGVGSGASRLVTGNHPLYAELEARLARLKDTEGACVFGSGFLANMGIIPALVGPDDLVLAVATPFHFSKLSFLIHTCLLSRTTLTLQVRINTTRSR